MYSQQKHLKIALIQLKVGKNKVENVQRACQFIRKTVADHSPKIVALPECFNSPYGTKYFAEYAETIPTGPTSLSLSEIAKELSVYVIGGSIPELVVDSNEKSILFNTCTIWSPTGRLLATHRKMHLFDIDVEGVIRFKESDAFVPGNKFTVIEVDDARIGIGICYDMRFEEMARIYQRLGCDVIIYPGAFDIAIGPLHWELLQRSRANDNQLFVATVSPARNAEADYVAWGHSMIVDPWGKVIHETNEEESVVVGDLDLNLVKHVRSQIPVSSQRRPAVYETINKVK